MAFIRAFRLSKDNLSQYELIIKNIWNNPNALLKISKNVANYTADDIINSFKLVQRRYTNYGLQYHIFQIGISEDILEEEIIAVMDGIAEYFESEFQLIGTYEIDEKQTGLLTFVINSTSFLSGKRFQDNNTQYYNITTYIKMLVPKIKKVDFIYGTLFNNSEGDSGCYV